MSGRVQDYPINSEELARRLLGHHRNPQYTEFLQGRVRPLLRRFGCPKAGTTRQARWLGYGEPRRVRTGPRASLTSRWPSTFDRPSLTCPQERLAVSRAPLDGAGSYAENVRDSGASDQGSATSAPTCVLKPSGW